jgi:four helix bundle protein
MVGDDIAERLVGLAVRCVVLAREISRDMPGRHIGQQLVRAVTSAGANYEEARRAQSRPDFVHKVAIAAKEMGETLYWLRLSLRLRMRTDPKLADEANELLAILVASTKTARSRL